MFSSVSVKSMPCAQNLFFDHTYKVNVCVIEYLLVYTQFTHIFSTLYKFLPYQLCHHNECLTYLHIACIRCMGTYTFFLGGGGLGGKHRFFWGAISTPLF